jgi:predicted nuclease of predicted toxin-antitoxin system
MSPSHKKAQLKLKFLLDENVDARLAKFLQKKGFTVKLCPTGLQNGKVSALIKKEVV